MHSLRGRFVDIKSVDQQAFLSLHRARSFIVRQRIRLINALRSLLAEFGVYISRGLARVIGFAQGMVGGVELELPTIAQDVFRNLYQQLGTLPEQVRWYELRLRHEAKRDARVRLLQTIPGVGVGAGTASALAASIGDGHQFRNGREFVAWLGPPPANKSSGGKERLGRLGRFDKERALHAKNRLK